MLQQSRTRGPMRVPSCSLELQPETIARLRLCMQRGELPAQLLWEQLNALSRAEDPVLAADRMERFFNALLQIPALAIRGKPGDNMHGYVPTPIKTVLDCLVRFPLSEGSTFCDLGSGVGRIPILVHLLSGCPAFGIEVDPPLAWEAQKVAGAAGLSQVKTIRADVRSVDLSFADTFFMYQPFEGPILRSVLSDLRAVAERKQITLWWRGHHCEWFSDAPWLQWLTEVRDKAIGTIAVAKSLPFGGGLS